MLKLALKAEHKRYCSTKPSTPPGPLSPQSLLCRKPAEPLSGTGVVRDLPVNCQSVSTPDNRPQGGLFPQVRACILHVSVVEAPWKTRLHTRTSHCLTVPSSGEDASW